MNQFGMQMPGIRSRKAEWSTIYTVMLFLACCALIAACAVMYQVSSSVGVDGQPWQMQQVNNIRLPAAT